MHMPLTEGEKVQLAAAGMTDKELLIAALETIPQLTADVSKVVARPADARLSELLHKAVFDYCIYRNGYPGTSVQTVLEGYSAIIGKENENIPSNWKVKRKQVMNLIERTVDEPINRVLGRETMGPWIM